MQELEGNHDKEPHIKELNQGIKYPFVDPKNVGSHFIHKRWKMSAMGGTHKKPKSNKPANVEAMVITQGDLNEIGDIVQIAT